MIIGNKIGIGRFQQGTNSNPPSATYSVEFTVTNGTTAIENAAVTLDGYGDKLTDINGVAIFENVEASTITYVVQAQDYAYQESSVTVVDANINKDIALELVPLLQSLVSYYPLNEETGIIAYDVHGDNDGDNNGATLGNDEYDFDGVSDNVDTNFNGNLEEFSIGFWVNGDTLRNEHIVSKYDYGLNKRTVGVRVSTSGKLAAYLTSDGTISAATAKDYVGATTLSVGQIYFCVVTYVDSSLDLYVNAVQDIPYAKALDATLISVFDSEVNFTIGSALNSGVPAINFEGKLKKVFIANPITEEEITWLFNEGNGRSYLDIRNSGLFAPSGGFPVTFPITL